jgi:hypothetical protein
MRCAHHPEVEAQAQCERCGDNLCDECEHQRAGESFCTVCGHALLDQRRAHLPRERALFRLGVGLVTFGLLPLTTTVLGMALAAASKLSGPPQGWLFYLVMGSALVATGAALLLRKPWARWSALVASLTWVVALPSGPLMTLWAVVLLARKSTAVLFDHEHARLVARTKELRAGSLLGGLGAVVGVLFAVSLPFVAFYNLVAEGPTPPQAVSSP